METQDIRTLRILEEIDNGSLPSQRDLARKLDVSLGLVNSFIKRLAHKGYFKITTIPANRVRYILTPKGATEKTRLTYEYIRYSFDLYRDTRRKLTQLYKTFEQERVRQVVFYGAGDLAEIAYISLQETKIQLLGIFDDTRAGEKFLGYTIQSSDHLAELTFDGILITTIDDVEEVMEILRKRGISQDQILFS